MWLDVLWLLPLVINGLLMLLTTNRQRPYWLALTITIIINYYMAYMVALFTLGFVLWHLALVKQSWRQRWKLILKYITTSLLAVGTSAVILLPTIYALTISKGTYHATNWHWRLEYNPIKLIGKLIPGTFNFDQMPTGQPNFTGFPRAEFKQWDFNPHLIKIRSGQFKHAPLNYAPTFTRTLARLSI